MQPHDDQRERYGHQQRRGHRERIESSSARAADQQHGHGSRGEHDHESLRRQHRQRAAPSIEVFPTDSEEMSGQCESKCRGRNRTRENSERDREPACVRGNEEDPERGRKDTGGDAEQRPLESEQAPQLGRGGTSRGQQRQLLPTSTHHERRREDLEREGHDDRAYRRHRKDRTRRFGTPDGGAERGDQTGIERHANIATRAQRQR